MEPMIVLVDSPFVFGTSGTEIKYNILPIGRFHDKRYGDVNITRGMIDKMAANFGKQPAYEVPVKFGHSDGAASPGKVKYVTASDTGLEITMEVDADTATAIKNEQYRYMSAEYAEEYIDKKTGVNVGPVLLGAALVNQPAHPDVAPLVLADVDFEDEKKGDSSMDEARIKELEAKVAALEAEKSDNAKAFSDMEAENKKLKAEKLNAEVKAFCDGWVAKGIPPAATEKAKLLLLAESRTIKLGEGTGKTVMTVLGEMFEALPKVEMGQKGKCGDIALSELEAAHERAKAIANVK